MSETSQQQSRLFTKPFAAIAIAQLFSLLGGAILKFVLPLYLLNLSGSATLYGIVVACAFVPYIFLTPIGGTLADRVNKKYIMAVLDLVMAASAVAYIVLAQTADLVVVTIVILMLLYAAQSVYQPTIQSSVPSVVAYDRIPSATAIVTQVSALTGLVGPVVGGLVFGFFGVMPIAIVSAVAFLVSSGLIVAFVKIPVAEHRSAGNPLSTLKSDIKDAASFLKKNPIMWKTILLP
ncbi:MFS transporter [Raoultibacter phocaeensis]|uniref:MFS transporter n=1 Tax=Raoultibacter phocaeensis TaxID=2479841 RepID=UPI0011180BF3|nr:MFS transporter [Raoultibacter phocaeensis]